MKTGMTMRCMWWGHYWVVPPIITLADLRYCKRCGARP
jgi:hypothetical protein